MHDDRLSRRRLAVTGLGLTFTAAELEATAGALPGAVAPLHRGAAAQAALDCDRFLHARSVEKAPDGADRERNGRPRGAPGFVVLEEPSQKQDHDDKRNETATDVHSGLLFSFDAGTTAGAREGLRKGRYDGAAAPWPSG